MSTQTKDEYIEELHEQRKVMRAGNQALRQSKEQIMAQRDALLEAAKDSVEWIDERGPTYYWPPETLAKLRVAIRLAEES